MRSIEFLAASLCLIAQLAFPAFAQSTLPPTPSSKVAVNPLTNKVYLTNTDANTVTVLDASRGTTTTIGVGAGPAFIAVNPETNRVYVDNARDSSLSVIDGAADSLLATYPIGSSGPISINPVTNVVYVVRLTGTGSDEVTYFDGNANTWYTIATLSYQPNAMAIDPVTNRIYVAHYATGDVRVISGAFNPNDDFPASTSIGVYSHPYAIAANPVTNKVYVITQDSRGPISVINGADNTIAFPAVASGHALQPQSLVVNPVTNKAYAAFANEVIVINGANNALTYIPISGAGTGGIALGINYTTNRIFAATASGSLTIINGDNDAIVGAQSIAIGTPSIGVNPVTDSVFVFDTALSTLGASSTDVAHAVPLTTTITPFPNNSTGTNSTLTLDASSSFSPNALPVRKVYYRLDSTMGPWTAASGSGPFTATLSGLSAGAHTAYAFAVDGQELPLATGPQSTPLVGQVAAYSFTVGSSKAQASVSLASSANPVNLGQAVTFTASVSGSSGVPTGTVSFSDGATTLCSAVGVSAGRATCSTSALAAGSHSIAAQYSGDATYDPAVSGALAQNVTDPNAPAADLSISQTASPNPASTGSDLTFSIAVSNLGSGAASSVTVTDTLPAGAAFVSASPGCINSSGTVTCSMGSLSSGANVQLSVVVRLASAGSVTNSARVAATEPDPVTANNSSSLTLTVNAGSAARLANISTRGKVLTGNDVLIGGFIIGGSASKTVVVRARGPSLTALGVPGALSNPSLQLVRSSDQATIAVNDDWQGAANASDISASGFAPPDALESAVMMTLPPGAYTAIVSGVGGATGVGMVEVFEVDHPEVPLINISSRGKVLTGNDVMIGGFIIQGSGPQTVVVRARGPSLAQYGVTNTLADPMLQLVRSSDQSTVAVNDNWQSAANAAQLSSSGFAPSDPNEAALLVTLDPGAYTVIVTGAGGGTGVGIFEVFAR